jgi:hypothetical protein
MVKIVIYDLLSNDEGILEQAMYRLGENVYDVDDEKMVEKTKAFFQIGGHLAIVSVLKKHPNCKTLQEIGIMVLRNATYQNTTEYRSAVAKIEGIQTIIAAMRKFRSNKRVSREGFSALCNIVYEHEANADLLVTELEGIPFLIEQMTKYRDYPDVMRDACAFLWNLSIFEQLRDPLVGGKAVTALGSAFERHKDNPDIRKFARETTALLMADSD